MFTLSVLHLQYQAAGGGDRTLWPLGLCLYKYVVRVAVFGAFLNELQYIFQNNNI